MHELGVVFHIADSVMKIAADNGASKIHSVTLDVGEVSTIIPYYLKDCWNWNAKRYDILTGAELIVETIHAVTHCGACGADYDTVPNGKICPVCGSPDTWLVTGNEVSIREIAVE